MELLLLEILNEILLKVDKPSLYHTSQVCKQWRQLSLGQIKIINNIEDFTDCCGQGDMLSIIRSKLKQIWLI